MKVKIIIVGANGQLGKEFQDLAPHYANYEFFFFDKAALDISNKEEIDAKLADIQPQYLINCAAYTAVDKAESDSETAIAINATAVGYLAQACAANNTRFVHVSTDYVFDGSGSAPYKEDHSVSPVNAYGQSKLKGEQEALNNNKETIIIRTAWVYSVYGNNFVKTMLRLMQSRPEINVVNDQFGTPTYAADIAEAILHIIESAKWQAGIYHFSNEGIISWFDFANAIKDLSGSSCLVHPITTSQYPTPAKRPAYSVLDKTKIKTTFGIKIKPWKDSLRECLLKMPKE